jgi:hypothetical protein
MYPGEKRCGYVMEVVIIQFFSLDYLLKFISAPFCRLAIFERQWLLNLVVPEPHSDHEVGWRTRVGRLSHFVAKPMNLVDLCAVVPFWFTLVLHTVPVPSACFRTLRLFRVVRLFRIGRFNTTLLVLGSVLAKSFDSIYVILVYIILTCLIAGGVLDQLEETGENGIFESVPHAGWWVFTRMTGVNDKSAPWAKGNATTWFSGALCLSLMVWKNLLWILPFGQIGTTFKEESAKERAQQDLVQQVKDEEAKDLKPGSEWMQSLTAPVARVEVWDHSSATGDPADSLLAGVGVLPLPLFEPNNREYGTDDDPLNVTVELHGKHMAPVVPFFLDPNRGDHASLNFGITWNPLKGGPQKRSAPKGVLSIEVLEGRAFRGSSGTVWSLLVKVPERLHGGETLWETSTSTGDLQCPHWKDAKRIFFVDWEGTPTPGGNFAESSVAAVSSTVPVKQSSDQARQACFKELNQVQEMIAHQTQVLAGISQTVGAAWEVEGSQELGRPGDRRDSVSPSRNSRNSRAPDVEGVSALVPLPW